MQPPQGSNVDVRSVLAGGVGLLMFILSIVIGLVGIAIAVWVIAAGPLADVDPRAVLAPLGAGVACVVLAVREVSKRRR